MELPVLELRHAVLHAVVGGLKYSRGGSVKAGRKTWYVGL